MSRGVIHKYIHIYTYINTYIMYTCIYTCIHYVCIYVCIYMYIFMSNPLDMYPPDTMYISMCICMTQRGERVLHVGFDTFRAEDELSNEKN